ncbi:hypothetical protein J6590_007770 [Homalodisca vitripennis]|nr:hypothetical protein J6590_007770 [Homalodisca vitripennis]
MKSTSTSYTSGGRMFLLYESGSTDTSADRSVPHHVNCDGQVVRKTGHMITWSHADTSRVLWSVRDSEGRPDGFDSSPFNEHKWLLHNTNQPGVQ